jgi:malate dehydrogenase
MLSDKLNVPVEAINNIIIWGNHSATQFADLAHGTVEIKPGQVQPYYSSNIFSD